MKISGAIIQPRNISINNSQTFCAQYKGRVIYVTTNHGFGKASYDHLTRYDITVTKDGSFEVNTYEDCHTMKDAIRCALKGACLL